MSHQSSNPQPVEEHVMASPGIERAAEETASDNSSNTQQRNESKSLTSVHSSVTRHQTPRPLGPKNPCLIFRLTAELRDIIYDELLLFEDAQPSKILHTQILATCKEVHAEALARLQGQNFKTTLLARLWLGQHNEPTIRLGSGETQQVCQLKRLYNAISSFPPTSSDLKRLVMVLTVDSGNDPGWDIELSEHDDIAKIQFQLYLLVTQALFSTAVNDVYFKAQFNNRKTKAGAIRLLSHVCLPLRQLDSNMTLHLNGIDDVVERRCYRAIPTLETLDKTALWEWLQVRGAVEALVDLTTRAGMYTSQLKVLLQSLCGNQPVSVGWEGAYARTEIDLTRSAGEAMLKLKDEPWKGLRERAEARLTDEGS